MSPPPDSPTEALDTPLAERHARNVSLFFDALFGTTVFAMVATLILSLPVLLAVDLVLRTNFSTLMILSTLGGLFLSLFFLGAIVYRKLWRRIGASVQIHPDRLVLVRKGKAIHFKWEDIREFYCKAIVEYESTLVLDRTYSKSKNHYRFVHRDGDQFEFGEHFQRDELVPISEFVTEGLLDRQLPVLRERFFQHQETLPFGPLRLMADGIGYGRSVLPWEQVEFVGMENGNIYVRKKDKTFHWCSVAAEKIPNFCLFVVLAKEKFSLTTKGQP